MSVTNRTWLIAVISIFGISACTNLPMRIHGSGVKIEPGSSDTGSIRSAGFWTDSKGISLRGEVSPNPADQGTLSGHVDIAITVPDGSSTVCAVAQLTTDRRHAGNTYAHRFAALPPRGTVVRLPYHASVSHNDCAG